MKKTRRAIWVLFCASTLLACDVQHELGQTPDLDGESSQGDGGSGQDGGPGDTCADAVQLVLANGTATVQGNTTGKQDVLAGTCGGAQVGDVGYRVTLASPGTLVLEVRALDPAFRPAVHVRDGCGASPEQLEGACALAETAGTSSVLVLHDLRAGEYQIRVDGGAGTHGAFELVARLLEPAAGDTCAQAIPVGMTGREVTIVGSTQSASIGNRRDYCYGFTQAPDLFFELDVPEPGNVELKLTSIGNWTPVVSMREGCTEGESGTGGTGLCGMGFHRMGVKAKKHYLWVDASTSFSKGRFKLVVGLVPHPPQNDCAGAQALSFDPQLGGTIVEELNSSAYSNNFSSSCSGGSGGDAVYTFDLERRMNVWVRAHAQSSMTQLSVAITQKACSLGTPDLVGCNESSPWFGDLGPGTYQLWVDGMKPSMGAVSLQVLLEPVAPGDTCNNPEPLVFSGGGSGGSAFVTDTTEDLFDNASSSCGGSFTPDRVYGFTTSRPLDLRARVTPLNGGYRPALYLRQAPCTGASVTCGSAPGSGQLATLSRDGLAPGTWYLWVDGAASGSSGPYELDAWLIEPGETCQNVIGLDVSSGSAQYTADLGDYQADLATSCSAAAGADAVFKFTTSSTRNLNITVSAPSGSGYRPAVTLRRGSCAGSDVACAAAAVADTSATALVANAPADMYFVVVGSADGSRGPFTLSVSSD
jgi:hypothetical protein